MRTGERVDDCRRLLLLANDLTARGDHAGAATALRKAKGLAARSRDLALVAEILRHLFRTCWKAGDIAGAQQALEEEVAVNRRLGDTYHVAEALLGLAFFPRLGSGAEKRRLLNEARELARKHNYKDIQQQIERRLTAMKMAGLSFDDFP